MYETDPLKQKLHNQTSFMPKKIEDDIKVAMQQLRFIKDDYAIQNKNGVLDEDLIQELKEKDAKHFDNQTKESVKTLFMTEIRKMIDIIKLENIVESHKAVSKMLQEEQNMQKVDKKLVSNYETGEYIQPICFWNDQYLYVWIVETLMDFKVDRSLENIMIDPQ